MVKLQDFTINEKIKDLEEKIKKISTERDKQINEKLKELKEIK